MRLMFVMVLTLLAIPLFSIAEEKPKRVSAWLDNDFLAPFQNDRWYSNGFGLDLETSNSIWGFRHEMYTPRNKRAESIVEDDRPYDGELSLVYLRKLPSFSMGSRDRAIFYGGRVGCVGPCAKAKRLQKFVHNDLDAGTDPRGWDNSNPTELLLNFIAYYRHESEGSSIFGTVVREETTWGTEVGTTLAEASIATDIEHDLAYGLYGVVGIEGKLVAYNTHLDGRLFSRNNHTVESIPFVAGANFGLGYRWSEWEAEYRYEYQTQEFEGQRDRHLFGSLSITKRFK